MSALFTPQPLLSLGLAAARTLLVFTMIAAGIYLRHSRNLRPLISGYILLFVITWVYAIFKLSPDQLLHRRLDHPYYYTVSLGLVATIAIWLLIEFWPVLRERWWFWPATLLSSATLLATQSRGALLALLAGCVGGILSGARRYIWPFLPVILGLSLLLVGRTQTLFTRLASDDLTGRDQVWQGAILAFQDKPWGGQGPYQAGSYYWFLSNGPCQLTESLAEAGIGCPAWTERLGGAWLTAHNVILHSLAETGIIGTLGLVALLGIALWYAFRARQSFLTAAMIGYLSMSLIDVVTTGPSPHFAELFWVIVGLSFAKDSR